MSYRLTDLIFKLEDLSHTEKLVLLALGSFVNKDHDYCWPSLPTLVRKTCLHRTNVIKTLKALEAKEYIKILHHQDKASNVYKFDIAELECKTQQIATSEYNTQKRVQRSSAVLTTERNAQEVECSAQSFGVQRSNSERSATLKGNEKGMWETVRLNHCDLRSPLPHTHTVQAQCITEYNEIDVLSLEEFKSVWNESNIEEIDSIDFEEHWKTWIDKKLELYYLYEITDILRWLEFNPKQVRKPQSLEEFQTNFDSIYDSLDEQRTLP